MIFLNILDTDTERIKEIADWILIQKYASSLEIDWNRNRSRLKKDRIETEKVHKLSCITRATLFNEINLGIQEKYHADLPEIYSVPIVYMDWSQESLLKNKLIQPDN